MLHGSLFACLFGRETGRCVPGVWRTFEREGLSAHARCDGNDNTTVYMQLNQFDAIHVSNANSDIKEYLGNRGRLSVPKRRRPVMSSYPQQLYCAALHRDVLLLPSRNGSVRRLTSEPFDWRRRDKKPLKY